MKNLFLCATVTFAVLISSNACSQRQQDQAQANTEQATDKTKGAANQAVDKTKDAAQQAGQGISEAGLTGKVKSKLAADVKLSTLTSIDVDSNGSVVTLSGHVPNSADKKLAERVAHSVEGVSKVVNQLTVAP